MNIYITDGSENGFYTAVFDAYTDNSCLITSSKNIQLPFDAKISEVQTDCEKADRVRRKLQKTDPLSLQDVRLILRRGSDDREMTAFRYIRLIVQNASSVRNKLSHPDVIHAFNERKRVTLEAHRFKGFLRFCECEGGIYYAPFAPDNDILDLIVPHFRARLASMPFIIHDTVRNKAALWNGRDCVFVETEKKIEIRLSDAEAVFESLWKKYYQSVNIPARKNHKLMKNYMPVRYWKYMSEKAEQPTTEFSEKPHR